jgi:anti-anti-sigma factor
MIQSIEFPHARVTDLERIHALVDEVCQRNPMEEPVCYALRLCIEEAFVNIVDHGYPAAAPGPVTITIQTDDRSVQALISDRAPAFHPENAPKPDLALDWDERQIGGLGWHFIRELMDEVRYEADEIRGNVLTLVKYLGTTRQVKEGRLEITVSAQGKVALIALGGRMDALSAPSVGEIVKKQIANGKKYFVADLGRLRYISSAGVFALLNAVKELRERGGDLRVASASKDVEKILELSGFFDFTRHFANVDAAIASFN